MKIFILVLLALLMTVFAANAAIGDPLGLFAVTCGVLLVASFLFVAAGMKRLPPGEAAFVFDDSSGAECEYRVYWPGKYYIFHLPYFETVYRIPVTQNAFSVVLGIAEDVHTKDNRFVQGTLFVKAILAKPVDVPRLALRLRSAHRGTVFTQEQIARLARELCLSELRLAFQRRHANELVDVKGSAVSNEVLFNARDAIEAAGIRAGLLLSVAFENMSVNTTPLRVKS